MIGQHIQHYRIVRQLGAGGMGVVYEAEDTRLGRHVALKFLPEQLALTADMIERFEREAKIASSLNHPNICTIYDVGTYEGRRFIAMELVDGESLRGRINGQPLPLDTILDLGCQLADALDAAHKKGIVHRDIKPANVFITRRGQAKLLDFGVAKLGGEAHAIPPADDATRMGGDVLTTPGMAVGSINYMSPEQARGEELDGRSDLFSLGLVLYEMATGRQAFGGQTTAVVFDAILNRQPADPRHVNPALPEDVTRVIMRALEKDRKMRFQTAADMLAELGRARRDTTGTTAFAGASGTSAAAAPPVKARVPSRWLVYGGLAVVAAAAAVYFFLWNPNQAAALTERDTILIADFVNTTGDPVFDDALRQAVSVQLQQSPFLTLLPDQRIQRTMRMMQQPPEAAVVGQVAREACQRAGAKATIEGSIAPLGSAFVISLGAHNCQTGAPLAEQQTQAPNKESVLKELGLAVTALRGRIGESLATIQKYDVPVTDATTGSLDALRAYGVGNRTRATKGDEAAIPFFKQAVELDPNFAIAHAKLGVVYGNLGRLDEAKASATRAYELRDRVSEYERLYINWNHASRVLNDQAKVLEALQLLTASYPRDFAGHNNLGVYYNGRGEFEKALESYRSAMALAPDEPLPHSNAAYVLLFLGRHEDAYKEADIALSLRPNPSLAVARWSAAIVAGDPRAAQFEEAAVKAIPPDQVPGVRANIALWRGQFAAFETYQEQARAMARASNANDALLNIDHGGRLARAVYLGGPAVDALKAAALKETNAPRLAQDASALSLLGDLTTVKAVLPKLLKEGKANPAVWLPATVCQAHVLASEGKAQDGVALLEAALRDQPRAQDLHAAIGRIRQLSGDAKGAIANYRVVIKAQSYFGLAPVVPLTRLMLAELLEKEGDAAGAREQYDVLKEQWKEADEGFAIKKRLK
ncbi:MAG TPA: protein kinase [Vicinamibacterales bacterium]|nr:protein kinase [Vicinamibacterales bacterium]